MRLKESVVQSQGCSLELRRCLVGYPTSSRPRIDTQRIADEQAYLHPLYVGTIRSNIDQSGSTGTRKLAIPYSDGNGSSNSNSLW